MVPVHSIGVWSVGGWEQDMSPEAPPICEAKEHDPVVPAAVVVLVLESLWCQLTRGVKSSLPFPQSSVPLPPCILAQTHII